MVDAPFTKNSLMADEALADLPRDSQAWTSVAWGLGLAGENHRMGKGSSRFSTPPTGPTSPSIILFKILKGRREERLGGEP
jgi:hypothetical protein